tara:strand:- start:6618 stop:7346 length:729 start_codon:yes stop_codon:yes gene_type:complete
MNGLNCTNLINRYMRVEEIIKSVEEGINDPHIFKAVFMAGGPGSGKSFVAKKFLSGTGLKMVNSDEIFEHLMKKNDLPLEPDTIVSPQGREQRDRAKILTKLRKDTYIDGRLGLVIDGTGKDVMKIGKIKEKLAQIGYDNMMLFVNTSEEVAQDRNTQRTRSIPTELVTKMWKQVQDNIMKFQQMFSAGRFFVVDNSGGLEDPERAENFTKVNKQIDKFLVQPPTKREAKKWIEDQKAKRSS